MPKKENSPIVPVDNGMNICYETLFQGIFLSGTGGQWCIQGFKVQLKNKLPVSHPHQRLWA